MKPPLRFIAAFGLLSLLLSLARQAEAAEVRSPRSLLPIETLLYFEFDGMASHSEAFDKTVLGQLLKDDLGPLVEQMNKLLFDALGPDVLAERLLDGGDPKQLIELQRAVKQLPRFLEHVNRHGVIVGVELLDGESVQTTIVFPEGGEPMKREAFVAALQLLAISDGQAVATAKLKGRTVHHLTYDGEILAGWAEGNHFLLMASGEAWEQTMERLDDKDHERVTSSPFFKQLDKFDDYETYARGFLDMGRGLGLLAAEPELVAFVKHAGLDGLSGVSVQLGCQGEYHRSTISIDTTRREGLLKLLALTDTLNFKNLPPLPPDASSVGAVSLEPAELLDSLIAFGKSVAEADDDGGGEEFEKQWKLFEQTLGVDVRDDLFAALGPTVVAYSAPSEGAFFTGVGLLAEVKDEEKLTRTLDKMFKALEKFDDEILLRKRVYRGTDLYSLQIEDLPVIPTVAVHDGWMVLGMNPQAAQGLVIRSTGEYQKWQPTPQLQKKVDELRADIDLNGGRKFTSFGQLDPRPTVNLIFSYIPLLFATGSFELDFDVSLLPNSQALTERLSPNFSVTTDDGKSIRIDSYETLPLLPDFSGIGSLPIIGGLDLF